MTNLTKPCGAVVEMNTDEVDTDFHEQVFLVGGTLGPSEREGEISIRNSTNTCWSRHLPQPESSMTLKYQK